MPPPRFPVITRRLLVALALGPLLALAPPLAAAGPGPLVAVAANMASTAEAIAEQFQAHTGFTVRLSVGASGNLARQIQRGAPFELFISADDGYPRRVAESGLARAAPVLYATGRLDLVVPPGTALPPTAGDARAILSSPLVRRLAIANPDHAPYGRAARQVLEELGLWAGFQGRLVIGESVSQAARFVTTSSVQAALLPRSMAIGPLSDGSRRFEIPEGWHDPILQHMVLLKSAGPAASALYDFMLGDAAREVLTAHGYAPPARNP